MLVIPAKAGIQLFVAVLRNAVCDGPIDEQRLDSGFRRNDEQRRIAMGAQGRIAMAAKEDRDHGR
ncbi:MAG TPA: hypothetical protein VF132_13485 [Rudaea sp.]